MKCERMCGFINCCNAQKGMSNGKKPSPIKQLGKLIVMTSTTLLDTFFSDDADKKNQSEKVKEIQRTLQEAAAAKHLVVLQVKTEKLGGFETVTGWIVGKTVAKRTSCLEITK